jgi:tetratricopeptide (TPR) repeat protein
MRNVRYATLAAVALAIAAWVWVGRTRAWASTTARAAAEQQRQIRDADIAFYEARAAQDPQSAEDRAMVAGLYQQRAREGGGVEDYLRAEQWALASLQLRRAGNGKAQLVLASALLARHHFPEALAAARALVAEQPQEPRYRALLAELLVEVGDYEGAGVQFDSLIADRKALFVAPRYARYLEFRGENARARALLAEAARVARNEPSLPLEQKAWFALRVADAEWRNGRLDVAMRTLDAGLDLAPEDGRLWALRARLLAARGQWNAALDAIERAGASADIQTRALAADAWEALGDSARARTIREATEQFALDNPEPFNRQWTMFRLEHARSLHDTRAILEKEILTRTDVFGWGQLAWARLLTGDATGADQAMQQALSVGTTDAWLWFIAGEVAHARGQREQAATWYRQALELNPAFHHRLASVARARLGS